MRLWILIRGYKNQRPPLFGSSDGRRGRDQSGPYTLRSDSSTHRQDAQGYGGQGRGSQDSYIARELVGRAIEDGHLQGMGAIGEWDEGGDVLQPGRFKGEHA